MSELIQKIETDIIEAIENDRLQLPTLPEVALRIRDVAEDEDSTVADLTGMISTDAAISARVIKVCNSPLLRGPEPVENLKMAINRLGMSYSADLAVGLAMSQMFQATSDVIDEAMRNIWDESTEIAGFCQAHAQAARIQPGQAALAGLTHRIGALPILTYAEEHPELLDDKESLFNVIDNLHTSLGERILRAWEFSDDVCLVPSNYLQFDRDSERPDLVDIVMVSYLENLKGSDHPHAQLDWAEIPAFAKLGIDPSAEDDEEDLSENMKAAMALLAS